MLRGPHRQSGAEYCVVLAFFLENFLFIEERAELFACQIMSRFTKKLAEATVDVNDFSAAKKWESSSTRKQQQKAAARRNISVCKPKQPPIIIIIIIIENGSIDDSYEDSDEWLMKEGSEVGKSKGRIMKQVCCEPNSAFPHPTKKQTKKTHHQQHTKKRTTHEKLTSYCRSRTILVAHGATTIDTTTPARVSVVDDKGGGRCYSSFLAGES